MMNYRLNSTISRDSLWTIALVIFFAVKLNYDWNRSAIIWYGSLAVLLVAYMFVYNGRFRLTLSPFFVWFLSFMVLGVISILWSVSAPVGVVIIKDLVILFAVLFLIQLSVGYGYKINTLLKSYFIATLANMVYVFLTVDIEQLGEVQLGVGLIEGWNGNAIGLMAAQGALIGIYLFSQYKSKLTKIILLAGVISLSIMTMYTGSRTAFIVLVVGAVLYFWIRHPTKLFRNIIITLLVVCIAFYLIMNVEVFYNVLGSRFEGLFALFGGEGTVDGSADIRNVFIENGIKWFSENPILGYGIGNYSELNGMATGRFTYAHNNFIEIAVDLGVIGVFLYYSVYIYLVVKLFKNARNNSMYSLLFASLVASLISHYGNVAYYELYQNLLLLLCFFEIGNKNQSIKRMLK